MVNIYLYLLLYLYCRCPCVYEGSDGPEAEEDGGRDPEGDEGDEEAGPVLDMELRGHLAYNTEVYSYFLTKTRRRYTPAEEHNSPDLLNRDNILGLSVCLSPSVQHYSVCLCVCLRLYSTTLSAFVCLCSATVSVCLRLCSATLSVCVYVCLRLCCATVSVCVSVSVCVVLLYLLGHEG